MRRLFQDRRSLVELDHQQSQNGTVDQTAANILAEMHPREGPYQSYARQAQDQYMAMGPGEYTIPSVPSIRPK